MMMPASMERDDRQAPAMIVGCTGAVDVIMRSTLPAKTNSWWLRGRGHNVAGNAVCDGGIVIDLSRMKGIRIDPVRHTARAEPVHWPN